MTLRTFSVSGDAVLDESGDLNEDGDMPILEPGDPTRKIRRYDELGQSLAVSVRLNERLLMAARDLAIIAVRLSPPAETSADGEASRRAIRKDTDWISDGLHFFWDLYEALERSDCYSCYLADQFGPGANRIHYFVSEKPSEFIDFVNGRAVERGFSCACERADLRRVAPDFLPIELIGQLGLDIGDPPQCVKVGFGFWGQEDSLTALRRALERIGFAFDEYLPYLRELRMARVVPVDQARFLEILKELVPLSRSLRCSYLGEETLLGHEPFMITSPRPDRYYPEKKTFFERMLGR